MESVTRYIENNNLNELQNILDQLFINKLRHINFNLVPIISMNFDDLSITIEYHEENNLYTEYFKKFKDQKFGYFLYSLVRNLGTSHVLYGGLVRNMFNDDEISDIDFYSTHNLSLTHPWYFKGWFSNENIDLCTYILYKLIYNENIKCLSIDCYYSKYEYYALIYENIKIDYTANDGNKKYDFRENMLCVKYINGNFVLESSKEYEYDKNLSLILISSFISNDQLNTRSNLLKNILEMIGDNFACVLESIYYITKKKLRISHDNCFNGNLTKLMREKIYLSDKIQFYRIPKFRNRGYKIIFGNICSKHNCICYIYKLIEIYEKQKYTVNFITFIENYYAEISLTCPLAKYEALFYPYFRENSMHIINILKYKDKDKDKDGYKEDKDKEDKKNSEKISLEEKFMLSKIQKREREKDKKTRTKNRTLDTYLKYL